MPELISPDAPDIAARYERANSPRLYRQKRSVRVTTTSTMLLWFCGIMVMGTWVIASHEIHSALYLILAFWGFVLTSAVGAISRDIHIGLLRHKDRKIIAKERGRGSVIHVPQWAIDTWWEAIDEAGQPDDHRLAQPGAHYSVFYDLQIDFAELKRLKLEMALAKKADETFKEAADSPRRLLKQRVKDHLAEVVRNLAAHLRQLDEDQRVQLEAQQELTGDSTQQLIERQRWIPDSF